RPSALFLTAHIASWRYGLWRYAVESGISIAMADVVQIQAAILGAGPAGLMAAEVLAQGGVRVTVFDAMPSAGRKFLMAGRGGLNLTHSEPLPQFFARYGAAASHLRPAIDTFAPEALRKWADD